MSTIIELMLSIKKRDALLFYHKDNLYQSGTQGILSGEYAEMQVSGRIP